MEPTGSLYCTPGTIITLCVNYTGIKKKKNKTKRQPNYIGNRFEQTSLQKAVQMAKNYKNKCSTSLAFREMQTKPTVRPTGMAEMEKPQQEMVRMWRTWNPSTPLVGT